MSRTRYSLFSCSCSCCRRQGCECCACFTESVNSFMCCRYCCNSGLQARAFPKAPANAPLDPEIEEEKARNSAFMYRVAAGDVAGVRKLMQQESFSFETHDGFSNSPLHWAAATGCTATCRALVCVAVPYGGVPRGVPKGRRHLCRLTHERALTLTLSPCRSTGVSTWGHGATTGIHLCTLLRCTDDMRWWSCWWRAAQIGTRKMTKDSRRGTCSTSSSSHTHQRTS